MGATQSEIRRFAKTLDDVISEAMVEKMSNLLPSPFLKKARISVFY
jgi:hypothetical protein